VPQIVLAGGEARGGGLVDLLMANALADGSIRTALTGAGK
jgi:hypothetical protein